MDTKWKRFRNNTAIKVIAFLLACTFAFLMSFSLFRVVAFAVQYSNENSAELFFSDFNDNKFINSHAFKNQFLKNITSMQKMAIEYKSDENVKNGKAFEKREKELLKEMEKEIKNKIRDRKKEVIENAMTYDENDNLEFNFNDGEVVKHYTPVYDVRKNMGEVIEIDGKKYYNGFPLDSVVINEEAIVKEFESSYSTKINNEKLEYSMQYEKDKESLKKLKNLKFAIRDKETGEVFSNMGDEVNSNTDIDSLVKKDQWSVAVQNGNYISGKNVNEFYINVSDDYYCNYFFDDYEEYYYEENYAEEGYYLVSILKKNFDEQGFDIFLNLEGNPNIMQKGDVYYELANDYEEQFSKVDFIQISTYVYFALFVLMVIFLSVSAGKLNDEGKTKRAKIDKLYNDIHFIIVAGIFVSGVFIIIYLFNQIRYSNLSEDVNYNMLAFGMSAVVAGMAASFVEWIMSVVRHFRCHTYWKHTLFYVLFIKNTKKLGNNVKKFGKLLKKGWNNLKAIFSFQKTKNLKTRMLQIISCYAGANIFLAFIFGMSTDNGDSGFAFFIALIMIAINISLVSTAKKTIKALDDMMEVLIQAENGKFDFSLDVYSMPKYLQDFAKHIVNLREGIKIAVDEAVKGERMKTELITNVSHDLKTPLTSIVTYVDLLKRCELEDETALGYITILEEKSERLKKLIEDLVEASKASTGNIKLNITQVNLNELAVQLTGEYEEEFTSLGIEMRVSTPTSAPIVKADSQKSYRAIENLFSNVKKYAMSGTRVYVDVEKDEKYGIVSIKNISKNALDMPVEELMQRFVRGDEARTSEGSGLGLSIADNLISLQNGEFDIEIDGDLFKAIVKLPLE